ncbi:unnamed protein product [Parascedosporium putredinis]|uniref:CHCH domain-containing protein n=1 Tax=Parascedosporium putredinis TaxID=1442378 RepID=A0A9P1GVE7_9PEZI|nr:unnamed protein product [Parascedosporium putredinis]CAI7988056.1 unnamed protein product [Parascedosporium putredinis]
MPRRSNNSRSMGAPARPTVPAKAPPAQTRPATTMAAPPAGAAPSAAAPVSQGPGLFGQMATTAAYRWRLCPVEAAPAANAQTQNQQLQNNCAGAAQQFTKCMDDQNGNMQICNWYLEQLKACQAAASQY